MLRPSWLPPGPRRVRRAACGGRRAPPIYNKEWSCAGRLRAERAPCRPFRHNRATNVCIKYYKCKETDRKMRGKGRFGAETCCKTFFIIYREKIIYN